MALEPIDYYDEAAWQVEHDREPQQRELQSIELMRPLTRGDGGRLLDVGCGAGLFLELADRQLGLTARNWSLHGIDYSQNTLEHAARLPYEFKQGNLEVGIPHDDEGFDVAYAGEVIEHVYDPDKLLREARRVLKPGGHLLITTPNLQAWYNRVLFAAGIQPLFYETSTKSSGIGAGPLARIKRSHNPVGHLRVFNRRALLDLLASEGFTPLELRGAVFHALPAPVVAVDRLFNRRPSLASNLVVLARRT